jgi:uncharacterized protein (TIGR03067 family)
MLSNGLTAVAIGLLMVADAKDDATKKDLEKFQGNWSLISAERDGKKMPSEEAKKIRLTIQGSEFILRKDAVVISEGSFTLDPTGQPKEVDETITTGPNKGKTFLAIYEIDDQHHTVCFDLSGKKRPRQFSSPPGRGHLLQVWKRDKK